MELIAVSYQASDTPWVAAEIESSVSLVGLRRTDAKIEGDYLINIITRRFERYGIDGEISIWADQRSVTMAGELAVASALIEACVRRRLYWLIDELSEILPAAATATISICCRGKVENG